MSKKDVDLNNVETLRGHKAPVDCKQCGCYKWPGIYKGKDPVWVCSNCHTVTHRETENAKRGTMDIIEEIQKRTKTKCKQKRITNVKTRGLRLGWVEIGHLVAGDIIEIYNDGFLYTDKGCFLWLILAINVETGELDICALDWDSLKNLKKVGE